MFKSTSDQKREKQSKQTMRNYNQRADDLIIGLSVALDADASRELQLETWPRAQQKFFKLINDFSTDNQRGLIVGTDEELDSLARAFENVKEALAELDKRLDRPTPKVSPAPKVSPVQETATAEDEVKKPTTSSPVQGGMPDNQIAWKYTIAALDHNLYCYTRTRYQGISPADGELQYHPYQSSSVPAADSPLWGSLDDHPDIKATAEKAAARSHKVMLDWTGPKKYAYAITTEQYADIKKHLWATLGKGSGAGQMSVSNNEAVTNCAAYLMTDGKAWLKEKLASHGWDLDDPGVLEAVAYAIQDVLDGGTYTGVTGHSGRMDNFFDESDPSTVKH